MVKKITLLLTLCFACIQSSTAQTILTEGFEGATFPPTGWTSFRGTNGLGTANDWIQATAPNTGTYSAANVYENVTGGIAEDWLVTSQIDLTSATNTELQFYTAQSYGTDYGSIYEVKVSTASQTNHSDFTTVASYNETTLGTAGFSLKTVDLSAYDGMMIYIAFVHFNDDGDNWIIDDILVRSPLNLDAELDNVSLNRYSLTSTDNQLSFDVFNNGINPITSLDVSWNDGTNNYSENFVVNITPGATQTINHSTPVNYSSVDEKDITVTISSVNGGADGDMTNNSYDTKFNTLSQSGTKVVLIEEATGTWCPWCPRGAVGMDYMASNYGSTTALVAVHNGDPMTVTEYDNGIGQYIGGYPSGVVDRLIEDLDPAQASLEGAYNSLVNNLVPLDLTASASQVGNNLTITVQGTFYSNFSSAGSNYRLGVIMTEDGVTGTTSGYNQANNYSGGGNGPMGGYEGLPNPVPAAQMVYDHVGRALLGGFNGEAGSIPATVTDGQTVSHTFNYTIPATSDENNMYIIAVLIDQNDGTIVGVSETSVVQALSIEEVSGIDSIKIFPNPAKDDINISFEAGNGDYNISVTDMLGRAVITKSYEGVFGKQNIKLSVSELNAGHYIMNINDGNASYSTKFIVNK
ncbi:MAG: choice-of-anchor J domain-containing protein [Winogradskyella sp.]|nr:choice-of-anchor J domain-containing protein [Winogradskyella sp.]